MKTWTKQCFVCSARPGANESDARSGRTYDGQRLEQLGELLSVSRQQDDRSARPW